MTPPVGAAVAEPATPAAAEPAVAPQAGPPAPTVAATPAAPAVPAEAPFALMAPEGAQVDPAYMNLVAERAKALGLDGQRAQQMLDAEVAHKAQTVAAWGEQIKADPEFAGEKLEGARAHARLAVERIWGAPFLDMLDRSGLGNYPDFFKGLAKFGATLAEPNAPLLGNPTPGKKRLFPEIGALYDGATGG